MKIRIKFSKTAAMKFIGHLDIMRYFQKAIRRAGIDIAFSEGFSPHMIMSFAAPLGVGITSSGEYFDMEVNSSPSSQEAICALNETMVEGMEILSYRRVEDAKASKAMSLVAAADYQVVFRKEMQPKLPWQEKVTEFYAQDSIPIWKKTKKSEREVDIRPMIHHMDVKGDIVHLTLTTGSVDNTKPELVMEAFASFCGFSLQPYALQVHRQEIYAYLGEMCRNLFVSLEDLGEDIE